jgi:hypothetical protein
MSQAEDDEAGKASAVGCDCREAGACCGSLERKDQEGMMSLCYAALHPKSVRNLITVVTPVDFHADQHDGLDIKDADRPCDVRIGSITSV